MKAKQKTVFYSSSVSMSKAHNCHAQVNDFRAKRNQYGLTAKVK